MRGLPADGAVARAEGVWPDSTELQVGALELLDTIARLIYAQSGKRPPGKPLRITRPGEVRPGDRTAARMAELLEGLEGVSDDGSAERR